ncbi:hypothetical protein PLESTB_000813300 [Pleodorina starrii]|uniref:EF-hand domain-containing protein n=1 Tax=Pleodorina starrii TaxID=330485 RepID=A0A9W6BKS3_9CHLO|nr:hypothetical protein PLESTB_000813300 [Pleodorina starrii]
MKECFELMDQDGSGAIDAEELGAAFKLLGIRMKRAELAQLLAEVDHDGSGEVEYPEFLEIMTVTLQRLAEEDDSEKNEGQVPFGLMATAYRRKRLMEGIINGHKEVQAQIQQISDKANLEALQATKAAEMEALRAKAGDGGAASGSSGGGASSSSSNGMMAAGGGRTVSGRPMRRMGPGDVNKALLDTLGPDERRIVNALAAKAPNAPRVSGAAPQPLNLAAAAAARPYSHFTNSPSHRQLMDTPQLLDLRFVHQSTIRLPPGAGGFTRSLSGALTGAASGMGGIGPGGLGSPAASHTTYAISGGTRDSTCGAGLVPPIGTAAMRRSGSNMRVGSPLMATVSASGAVPGAVSPGRAGRGGAEEGLPQLRYDGGAAAKQPLGVRLGLHSARQERSVRGS